MLNHKRCDKILWFVKAEQQNVPLRELKCVIMLLVLLSGILLVVSLWILDGAAHRASAGMSLLPLCFCGSHVCKVSPLLPRCNSNVA